MWAAPRPPPLAVAQPGVHRDLRHHLGTPPRSSSKVGSAWPEPQPLALVVLVDRYQLHVRREAFRGSVRAAGTRHAASRTQDHVSAHLAMMPLPSCGRRRTCTAASSPRRSGGGAGGRSRPVEGAQCEGCRGGTHAAPPRISLPNASRGTSRSATSRLHGRAFSAGRQAGEGRATKSLQLFASVTATAGPRFGAGCTADLQRAAAPHQPHLHRVLAVDRCQRRPRCRRCTRTSGGSARRPPRRAARCVGPEKARANRRSSTRWCRRSAPQAAPSPTRRRQASERERDEEQSRCARSAVDTPRPPSPRARACVEGRGSERQECLFFPPPFFTPKFFKKIQKINKRRHSHTHTHVHFFFHFTTEPSVSHKHRCGTTDDGRMRGVLERGRHLPHRRTRYERSDGLSGRRDSALRPRREPALRRQSVAAPRRAPEVSCTHRTFARWSCRGGSFPSRGWHRAGCSSCRAAIPTARAEPAGGPSARPTPPATRTVAPPRRGASCRRDRSPRR